MSPQFTPEQRAAIEDRAGSRLLAANAGSGKTAVMVERFVEAVLRDGVPTGAILALTFTEKAAGELRDRLRRRFAELGEHERAREAESAWVGTIHGFCARVLRAHPLAAGLDPSFAVLDEAAAGRVARSAWEQAVERWAAAGGQPAIDLLAAYGPGLADAVLGAHAELRSRGRRSPQLPVPAPVPVPDPVVLRAARDAAAALLAGAGDGVRIAAARRTLDACASILDGQAPGSVPVPAALDAARLGNGAKILGEQACLDYRDAWEAYRRACADHHARAALELLDALLAAFTAAYAEAKGSRAALDFEDLQLGVRDLLAGDAALRGRWSQRFELLMVDEFQDTNRLQLDVLEMLERDRAAGDPGNLFAVGDEFQSIYGFRHADVGIFRARRDALGAARTRRLRANFRSHEELLDVLNGAFAPLFNEGFEPLVAGHPERRSRAGGPDAATAADGGGELRLFDPDHIDEPAGEPRVELMVTDTKGWDEVPSERLGLELPDAQPWRRAEARRIAARLRALVDRGRRPGEIVVLVRAAASLRLLEQALEEQRLPTYVVGGRGYWSQEQVRDGLAYLAALANPLDEAALLSVLASPFCGAGADALVLAAQAGREAGGVWAALRAVFGDRAGTEANGDGDPIGNGEPDGNGNGRVAGWPGELPETEAEQLARFVAFLDGERAVAERLPVEVLLDRAQAATGYDVAVLGRPGGERRLANLRKLMRLARDYERAEGRDLRGFVRFASTQDLSQAREGEAALEGEGLDAVRLMTIHRAKGLEFPVVCVADLGRLGPAARPRLLVGDDGRVGLRLVTLGGGGSVPALDYDDLWAERERAEAEEERRLLYVAMTRAEEHLILSGGYDLERAPAPRAGGPPMDWIVPALAPGPQDGVLENTWEGRPARLAVRITRLEDLPEPADAAAGPAAPGTALPPPPRLDAPAIPPGQPPLARTLGRLSYSSLGSYARCGYRFYLQRVLGLPDVAAPPAEGGAGDGAGGLDARLRGTLVHAALEHLDLRAARAPDPAAWRTLAAGHGAELSAEDVADLTAQVEAFAGSQLRSRLARARSVRREAPFALPLEPGGAAPLLHGVVDVIAREGDGAALVVDYKTDRLDGADPGELADRAYATQRAAYALAALADGAPRVEVCHLFLERPDQPASAVHTAADADRLREHLLGLASGVLAGRFEVASAPHRELCGTCPGRRALCRHPESLTLRPAAYDSAGSFSGAGGPA